MKFQQIIFALNRIIQVLISLEFTLLNIIPKSLVTLQFLKFLIVQIKAYIQGFQMRYQSFLGHWYPNSYSWFSDSMDILFVLITTVTWKKLQITLEPFFLTVCPNNYDNKILILILFFPGYAICWLKHVQMSWQ